MLVYKSLLVYVCMPHSKACVFHDRPILVRVYRGGYTDGRITGYIYDYIKIYLFVRV